MMLATASASAQYVSPPSVGVPTWWIMMVTGEKDGVPWIRTSTPETLGSRIKGTGEWACALAPTQRGTTDTTGWEKMELACAVGEAEVFLNVQCNYRTKAKAGVPPGKRWKRGELQTLNLRRRGDTKSAITVSLRCDVDAAFATD